MGKGFNPNPAGQPNSSKHAMFDRWGNYIGKSTGRRDRVRGKKSR